MLYSLRMHQMTLHFYCDIYFIIYIHSVAANREASYNIVIVRLDILSELTTKKRKVPLTVVQITNM